jgi:hypothetical protein
LIATLIDNCYRQTTATFPQIKMWSKGPFKSRLPIRNPTLADKTSGNLVAADPAPAGKYAKDLPALP